MTTDYIIVFVVGVTTLTITGVLLGIAYRLQKKEPAIISDINDLLPQTQCGQCGYPGCRPYARAIATGEAINKCPPGGKQTIDALATLLNVEAMSLVEAPKLERVAMIREADCIGCTLCIKACPVDAIVGTQKAIHTVITDYCTGCDLCLPSCPVDCIDMIALDTLPRNHSFTREYCQ